MPGLDDGDKEPLLGDSRYYAPLYEGIFDEDYYLSSGRSRHLEQIGKALPMFLWFIARTTEESIRNGTTWGAVLGGSPIKIEEIPVPGSWRQKQRYISRLERYGYIRTYKSQYGLRIFVLKSKRNFRTDKVEIRHDKNDRSEQIRHDKNGRSGERQTRQICPSDMTDLSTGHDKNVISLINIDGQDSNKHNETACAPAPACEVIKSTFKVLFDTPINDQDVDKVLRANQKLKDEWEGYYNRSWEDIITNIALSRMADNRRSLRSEGRDLENPVAYFMEGIFKKDGEKYLLMFDGCGEYKKS
ncbi:hypothetical protein ACFL6I_12315 [candidate division KSB1 bacterium]